MSFTLKGQLTDGNSQQFSNYIIKAYRPISDIFGDELLGSAVTLDDGTFRIDFTKESFKKPEFWANNNHPEIYLKVFDTDGDKVYESDVIDPNFVGKHLPSNELKQCEALVVGSGFAGTIITSSLVNKYVKEDQNLSDQHKRKVVLLERGQWCVIYI